MRPIKFRGRKTDNSGEFVFGDLAQFKTNILPANHYFILHNGYQDEVEPDSVAQLVGYDANGKEVYEGDTVVDKHGRTTVVDYRDNPEFVALHTLEEADQ